MSIVDVTLPRLYADVALSPDKKIVAAAAYVSSADAWKHVRKEWTAILRAAGVNSFHATDFFAGRGEFRDWDPKGPKHLHFVKRFTACAANHAMFGVGVGLDRQAYLDLLSEQLRHIRSPESRLTPEAYCVSNCLEHVARLAQGRPWRMDVFLEAGGGMEDCVAHLRRMQERREPSTLNYNSFATAPKSEREMQAADLLTFETCREIGRLMGENAPRRAMRKSLVALNERSTLEIKYATRAEIEKSLPNVLRAVRERYW